jgi:hypothetical protein
MSSLGQKRPKLSWVPAAKSTTEQRGKFVRKGDLCRLPRKLSRSHYGHVPHVATIEPRDVSSGPQDLSIRWDTNLRTNLTSSRPAL